LKRERERFPLFVPIRYCVMARTFPGVPNRSPFLTFLRPEELRSDNETFRKVKNVGRSETVNSKGRWTFSNVPTVQDKRAEEFAKSLSRSGFKKKGQLYFILKNVSNLVL
jgi:hypothetical protein